MITLDKLDAYAAFDGDLDGWTRSTAADDASMTDADWYMIDALLGGLATIGSGLASSSFRHDVETRLHAATADDATRDRLRALAARHRQ